MSSYRLLICISFLLFHLRALFRPANFLRDVTKIYSNFRFTFFLTNSFYGPPTRRDQLRFFSFSPVQVFTSRCIFKLIQNLSLFILPKALYKKKFLKEICQIRTVETNLLECSLLGPKAFYGENLKAIERKGKPQRLSI